MTMGSILLNRKLGFLACGCREADRKNMKTQKEYFDYTRGGYFGEQIQKFIETETLQN